MQVWRVTINFSPWDDVSTYVTRK